MTEPLQDHDVLTILCQDMRDAIEGYREAADLVGDHPFHPLFDARQHARETMLYALETRLSSVTPASEKTSDAGDEPSLRGIIHQKFMHVRALFQSDETAALGEVQAIEDYLAEHLRESLGRHVSLETYAMLTDFVTAIDASRSDADLLLAAS